jgi:hypothetical protein
MCHYCRGAALSNMLLKSRLRRSDVPLHSSFANGSAILMQTNRSAARRLAKCYIFKEEM